MCLYTLGSRGSRELKTFLETRLISSRVDQNLRTKKGEYTGFKEYIGPNSWVIGAVVEAICKGRGSSSLGRRRSSRIWGKLISILASNVPRSCHDQATIAPWSGHDSGLGNASHAVWSSGNDSTLKEVSIVARLSSDHAAIGSRSGYDRSSSSCFVCRLMKIGSRSTFARSVRRPMGGYECLDASPPSVHLGGVHDPDRWWMSEDEDRTMLSLPRVVR